MYHLYDIQNYARQYLKLASDWIKTDLPRADYQEGDRMWLYLPTGAKGYLSNINLLERDRIGYSGG
jgi:hypothetical protein